MYNSGINLMVMEEYGQAMDAFVSICESDVDTENPDSYLMDERLYRRHRAAVLVSKCFEAEGNWSEALAWARTARTTYSYESRCGTCLLSEKLELAKRIDWLERELDK